MKNLVPKYAMTAVCFFSSITFASNARASDFAEQNIPPIFSTHLLRVELLEKNSRIESLEEKVEDLQFRLDTALEENAALNRERRDIEAIKEYARSVEERYLKELKRANDAISEREELKKMHVESDIKNEIVELKRQAKSNAEIIVEQDKTIEKLKKRLSLRRL